MQEPKYAIIADIPGTKGFQEIKADMRRVTSERDFKIKEPNIRKRIGDMTEAAADELTKYNLIYGDGDKPQVSMISLSVEVAKGKAVTNLVFSSPWIPCDSVPTNPEQLNLLRSSVHNLVIMEIETEQIVWKP